MMARMLVFVIVLAANPFASAQESTFGSVGETTPVPPPPIPALATIPSTKLTTITYSVADLVVPLQGLDYPWSAAHDNEHTKTKEAWLMQKITSIVAPKSWKDLGGRGTIQYFPLGMAVVVKQTPEVQVQVADLLATMRRVQNVEVAVDMRLLNVTNPCFAKLRRQFPAMKKDGQLILNEKQVAALVEEAQGNANINIMQIPRLTVCPGQRGTMQIDALKATFVAMVAGNLRHVDLSVKVDAPESEVKFEKAVRLVDGTTLVLFARNDDGDHVLCMVTPRVVISLSENVVAPIMPPSLAYAATMPNKVIQASAAEVVVPPRSGPLQKLREKQIAFKVSVLEGDPLGNREANTVRTLVDTNIITLEGRPFSLQAGGEVSVRGVVPDQVIVARSTAAILETEPLPVGVNIQGTPSYLKDGKLRMELTVSKSTAGDQSGGRVQVQTDSTRTILTMALGELVRVRLGKKMDDVERWVEITATEVSDAGSTVVAPSAPMLQHVTR